MLLVGRIILAKGAARFTLACAGEVIANSRKISWPCLISHLTILRSALFIQLICLDMTHTCFIYPHDLLALWMLDGLSISALKEI